MNRSANTGAKRWRALVSSLCIVVAGVLVPVSILATSVRQGLVSENAFVQTFAPLANDPQVQDLVIDRAVAAIHESVNIEQYTNDLFDSFAGLNLPRTAQAAILLLRQPALNAVNGFIDSTVRDVVESKAFSALWERALTQSHRALVAVATNDSSEIVHVDKTGALGIQIGPIIEGIKSALVERGFGLASLIPTIDRTIVIVQADGLLLVATVYSLAVNVGWWLPVITVALIGIGILISRRKRVAVLGAGVTMAVGAALLIVGLVIAGSSLSERAISLGIPATTMEAIFLTVVGGMRNNAIVVAAIGVVLAVSAWLHNRWLKSQFQP